SFGSGVKVRGPFALTTRTTQPFACAGSTKSDRGLFRGQSDIRRRLDGEGDRCLRETRAQVRVVYISSGSIAVQAMVGGNLDMSIAASNAVVSAILRSAPLVAVGSITNRPAMSLFVQPEITKPEQLQGKTLAITRHGSATHFLTLFALEKLGLHDKVKIQP